MTGAQLGLDFEAPRLVRVTPARLATWDDCPRRYRLTYLDRPAPARSRRAGRRARWAPSCTWRCGRSSTLPPARRTPEAAARLVDRHWTSEGFRDAEQAHRLPRARARAGSPTTPRARPRSTPSGWSSGCRWRSAGSSRRAGSTGSTGGATSWSSSTTRPAARPTAEDARESRALALYALGVGAHAAAPLRRGRAAPPAQRAGRGVAARPRRRWRRTSRRRSGRPRPLAVAAEDLAAGADPEARFPARPAPRCGSCDVRRHCPEGRAAAPESEPWAQLSP